MYQYFIFKIQYFDALTTRISKVRCFTNTFNLDVDKKLSIFLEVKSLSKVNKHYITERGLNTQFFLLQQLQIQIDTFSQCQNDRILSAADPKNHLILNFFKVQSIFPGRDIFATYLHRKIYSNEYGCGENTPNDLNSPQ